MAEPHQHEWIDKKTLIDRARRVEGQAGAVVRMIQAERTCAEVLQQVAALNSAAQRLAVLLLEDHIVSRQRSGAEGEEVATETAALIRRILKI